jgi:predicted RNase H-like HicB family nuclease
MKYAVIFEKGETSYGAYIPDLPGCIAVGETLEDVERLIREAITFHLDGLKAEGLPIPEPTTRAEYIETI